MQTSYLLKRKAWQNKFVNQDSLREMFKYRQVEDFSGLTATDKYSDSEAVREFMAQRNVYMTFMSLFLWL